MATPACPAAMTAAPDCVCASIDARANALNANDSNSSSRSLMDLLIVVCVGVASLVVLFRLVVRARPVPSIASLPPPSSAHVKQSPPSATVRRVASAASITSSSSAAALTNGGLPPLPGKRSSVKDRLEAEIRALLPRKSTYYASPFFADTITTKHEFLESLVDLGDDLLDGWLLVKRGTQRGKNWKKRFVVLDSNGRIKYYPNAEAARKNVNIKGSLVVHAVKPADPMEFGANTLEVRGTLGGTYFFRTEGEMAARKWLCVLTKRAIQSRVPGRIDAAAVPSLTGGSSGQDGESSSITASGSSESATDNTPLKSHKLEAFVDEMTYSKEASLRQFYVVVKFKSELHDHSSVPVGQTVPKNCDKSAINWKENLAWHFTDHLCSECDECKIIGSRSGSFKGLPDIMVLHVYEIHLRYLTTKIGQVAISLKEVFGFTGMKEATMACTWPVISSTDAVLGQLSLKLNYSVDLAGGAATVPFLVTTAGERETLGEYEIHPSIKDCREFFNLFYANGTLGRWQGFFQIRGDTELEMGEWSESSEYGGQVRSFTFRALTNASIGPATTMSTQNQHISFTDVSQSDPERLVVELRVFLHDIPYGDCFTVEQVYVIERGSSGHLVAKAYLGIPFSKGCMFKSKIISATREGVGQSAKIMFEELNKSIESGRGPAAAPVKPFLLSTEEERHLVGTFEIHANVRDPTQFFELFYGNGTLSKWQAFYKEMGDTDHDVSDWKESAEYGGMTRLIKYRAQNTAPIGPPSTTADSDQHVILPKDDDEPLVLETKMELHQIPYGDCFSVETIYIVERVEPTRLVARVYVAVPFKKSTMFRSKIVSGSRDGVSKTTTKLFEYLSRVAEADAGARVSETELGARSSNVSQSGVDRPRTSSTSSSTGPRRVLLARLNSTLDGSVALEEIFENQRVSIFGKWGPNHLLPTDRERFTNRNGDVVLSFDQITHPPQWTWTAPWRIDKSYTECDDEGWSYATDFPRFKSHLARGRSSQKRLGNSVRRRRWIRMMAYVPADGSAIADGSPSPLSTSGGTNGGAGSRPASPSYN